MDTDAPKTKKKVVKKVIKRVKRKADEISGGAEESDPKRVTTEQDVSDTEPCDSDAEVEETQPMEQEVEDRGDENLESFEPESVSSDVDGRSDEEDDYDESENTESNTDAQDESKDDEEEEEQDVVSSGTSAANPNMIAPAPKTRIVFCHQPSPYEGWDWRTQLAEKTMNFKWQTCPIINSKDNVMDGDAKLRKSYYFHNGYTMKTAYMANKPRMAKPLVQLAPMFVLYERMSGMGRLKFGSKSKHLREYEIVLTPKLPKNVYGDTVTIYDQNNDVFKKVAIDSPEMKQIERAAMLCFNGLVKLHIKQLRREYDTPNYKTMAKETQRAEVMDEMKLEIKNAGTTYLSTHNDYKDMSSHALQEMFEEKCFTRWLDYASTPFGQVEKNDPKNKGKSSGQQSESDIPDIPLENYEMQGDTDAMIDIYGDSEEIEVKHVDIEEDEDTPWHTRNSKGNYGGAYPQLRAKRNTFFGLLENVKYKKDLDVPGTVPLLSTTTDFLNTKKLPDDLIEPLDETAREWLKTTVNLFKLTYMSNECNYVQTVYRDPFMRPLERVAGMSLLQADATQSLASRGSIVSIGVETMRKQYPEDQTMSYGTMLSLGTDVAIVAAAKMSPAARQVYVTDRNFKDLSDAEKEALSKPVTELFLTSNATYQVVA